MTSRKSQTYSVETLFKGLNSLLNSLPTDEEKRALVEELKEARDFLDEMAGLVDLVPTLETSEELALGMSRLNALTERAQDGPMRRLLGLRNRHTGAPKPKTGNTGHVEERVSDLIATINQSESSAIKEVIHQETVTVLKALADALEIVYPSKDRKPDLVDRIANHIQNRRGYALLRGERHHPDQSESHDQRGTDMAAKV